MLPVHSMFPFDHFPLGVSLAGLYEISTAARVQLQTMRSLPITGRPHLQNTIDIDTL